MISQLDLSRVSVLKKGLPLFAERIEFQTSGTRTSHEELLCLPGNEAFRFLETSRFTVFVPAKPGK